MNDKRDEILISLSKDELRTLVRIMNHFTDYMIDDGRVDYRVGMLKYYREMKDEGRDKILALVGKIRALDKLYNKIG